MKRTIRMCICGQKYEWSIIIQSYLCTGLDDSNVTYYCADRFSSHNSLGNVIDRGEKDLKRMLASKILVICGDNSETDAGSSAIIGMAKKLGKAIILYYSSPCDIVEGKSACYRNLMIELSANYICKSYQSVLETIRLLVPASKMTK